MRPEMARSDWWREFAAYTLGERDGPICARCGVTITPDQLLSALYSGMCEECERGDST